MEEENINLLATLQGYIFHPKLIRIKCGISHYKYIWKFNFRDLVAEMPVYMFDGVKVKMRQRIPHQTHITAINLQSDFCYKILSYSLCSQCQPWDRARSWEILWVIHLHFHSIQKEKLSFSGSYCGLGSTFIKECGKGLLLFSVSAGASVAANQVVPAKCWWGPRSKLSHLILCGPCHWASGKSFCNPCSPLPAKRVYTLPRRKFQSSCSKPSRPWNGDCPCQACKLQQESC